MDYIFRKICCYGTLYNNTTPRYNEENSRVICDRCKREDIEEYRGLDEYEYDLCLPCANLLNQVICNRNNILPLSEHERMIRRNVHHSYSSHLQELTLMEQDQYQHHPQCEHANNANNANNTNNILKIKDVEPSSESMSRMEQNIYCTEKNEKNEKK
jgi:hypothetical protein